MILRMLGSDADVDFPETAVRAVKKLEERFPCPEWAVIYAESEPEDEGNGETEPDQLVVCRRYEGILLQMAFIGLDEVEEMEADGFDWVADLEHDLAMTQEEVMREVEGQAEE